MALLILFKGGALSRICLVVKKGFEEFTNVENIARIFSKLPNWK